MFLVVCKAVGIEFFRNGWITVFLFLVPFLARVTRFGDSGASIIKYDCKKFPPREFCEWN
jgi:hypothetical protein